MLLGDSFLHGNFCGFFSLSSWAVPHFRVPPLHPATPDSPSQLQPSGSPTTLTLSRPYPGRPLSWTRFLLNDLTPFPYPGSTFGIQDSLLRGGYHFWGTAQAKPPSGCPGPLQLSLAQARRQRQDPRRTPSKPLTICVLWGERGGGRDGRLTAFFPRNLLFLSTRSAILYFPLYVRSLISFLTNSQTTLSHSQ